MSSRYCLIQDSLGHACPANFGALGAIPKELAAVTVRLLDN